MTRVCDRPQCANPLDRLGSHVRYCCSACRGEAAHERYANRGGAQELPDTPQEKGTQR